MHHAKLLKSVMGEELYESLNKALNKLTTSSVVDIGELYHSLKVAPKAVVAFLVKELKDMTDAKEIKLPWSENSMMLVNKLAEDVYAGHIVEDGQIKHEFKLSSIPALAAHLTSHFELYEEKNQEGDPEQKEEKPAEDKVKELESKLTQLQIQALESKINSLMSIVASRKPSEKVDSLAKAGLMPKMPSPPAPGKKVGGNQGITAGGLHGPKTDASDRMSKPIKSLIGKPMISVPPKAKTLTFKKSDMMQNCLECHESEFDKSGLYKGCSCWKGMSKPQVKKSDKDTVTLELPQDWDDEAVIALIRSVKKYGRDT